MITQNSTSFPENSKNKYINRFLLYAIPILFISILLGTSLFLLGIRKEDKDIIQIKQTISQYFIDCDNKDKTALEEDFPPSSKNKAYVEVLLDGLENTNSISLETIRAINVKGDIAIIANVSYSQKIGNNTENSSSMIFLKKSNDTWFIAKPSDLSDMPYKQAYIKTYASPIWNKL